jgi:cytochrome c oxidase subunit 2
LKGPNRFHALRLLIAWAVLSVIGVVIAMQIHMPPGDQSRQGSDESSILQLMLILSTPVFIGVVLFILYSALVFRQARGVREARGVLLDGPPSRGDARLQWAWVGGTAVVVLILAVVGISELASSATATNFSSSGSLGTSGSQPVGASAGHELHVQVIGQQWYFTYRYPDYGGVESLHLVLPVNANVELHVTSTDILHSFWAYELGVKADANPGVDNVAYVTTMRTGFFTVRCAELCGLWHGNMVDTQGEVASQSDFATWIKNLQTSESDLPLPPYAPAYFPSPRVKGT